MPEIVILGFDTVSRKVGLNQKTSTALSRRAAFPSS